MLNILIEISLFLIDWKGGQEEENIHWGFYGKHVTEVGCVVFCLSVN